MNEVPDVAFTVHVHKTKSPVVDDMRVVVGRERAMHSNKSSARGLMHAERDNPMWLHIEEH